MIQIQIAELDVNLMADIGLLGWQAFQADYEGATVSNQCYHIVFNALEQRGGIVFVGSGSSGRTHWTDADSAQEVLDRFLSDEMCN